MANEMNLHQAKRKESNEKIVAAAIKCFGEKGYTHTSIAGIAKCAGVSVGLMTNRFDKESLLIAAYSEACSKVYHPRADYATLQEMLLDVIEQTRKMQDEEPVIFNFILMILNSRDIPESFYDRYSESLDAKVFYPLLCEGQERGIIPQGDILPLLHSFMVYVLNHLDNCKRFGVKAYDNEALIDAMHIVDSEKYELEQQREALLQTLCNTYTALSWIKIDSDEGEHMRFPDFLVPYANTDHAQDAINESIVMHVGEEYQEEFLAFMDMSTISERIGDKRSITRQCVDKRGRKQLHTIAPHRRDDSGRVTEVLIGFQEID